MKQIINFVLKLVKNFFKSDHNEAVEQFSDRTWALIVTIRKDINTNGKIRRNSVRMPAEFCIKHPFRGEMLTLTHSCAHCYTTRSQPTSIQKCAKKLRTVCHRSHRISIVEHDAKYCNTVHGVEALPCWAHSFILRRHSIGPQSALERNFFKAYRPNNVIEILPPLCSRVRKRVICSPYDTDPRYVY